MPLHAKASLETGEWRGVPLGRPGVGGSGLLLRAVLAFTKRRGMMETTTIKQGYELGKVGDMRLSSEEEGALTRCERVIDAGKETFLQVGAALAEIRDGRLYRAEHKTFEEYCQVRHGWTRRHANHVIAASAVTRELANAADLGTRVPKSIPSSTFQARPLAALPTAEARAEAWGEAEERAGGNAPTGRQVQAVVDERLGREAPVRDEEPRMGCGTCERLRAERDRFQARVVELEAEVARLTGARAEVLADSRGEEPVSSTLRGMRVSGVVAKTAFMDERAPEAAPVEEDEPYVPTGLLRPGVVPGAPGAPPPQRVDLSGIMAAREAAAKAMKAGASGVQEKPVPKPAYGKRRKEEAPPEAGTGPVYDAKTGMVAYGKAGYAASKDGGEA